VSFEPDQAYKKRLDDAATIASGAMFFTWQHQDAAKKLKAKVRRLCG
jgi:hypothetical protein